MIRLLVFVLCLTLGWALALRLTPWEQTQAQEALLSFPDSQPLLYELRPWALGLICLMPALGALYHLLAGTLDRYIFRRAVTAFLLCGCALATLWLLLDVEDNINEYKRADNTAAFLVEYYAVNFGPVFLLMAPFALMLGLLYSLSQFSNSREIIAMTQSGRGITRIIRPLLVLGLLTSGTCFCLNYHLAPWGEGYKDALLESTSKGSTSQARNVLSYHHEGHRLWLIGGFPYDHAQGTPLRDVVITRMTTDGQLRDRIYAPEVTWNRQSRTWALKNAEVLDLHSERVPQFKAPPGGVLEFSDWLETPWQLLRPGLTPRHLGIPDLASWLKSRQKGEFLDLAPFYTQWHYRWAQPWLCLIIVMLAAPLGIAYSRRGNSAGVALAVLLSALMLFSTEVFLTLGDSGYLPPTLAAWGTNLIFAALGLYLLKRRLEGRPIHQIWQSLISQPAPPPQLPNTNPQK